MAYKRELIAKTKNLFDLATASVGYIDWEGKLNHSEDTITYASSSDYLECTPNTSYTISAFCGKHPVTNDSTLWCRIAYYDENKQLLTAPSKFFTDTNIDYISATWTAPTNAKYLRASSRWMSPTYRQQHPENWVMLEKGTTATDYVPYGYLSSYKKLLKVSDVCQLLDKSKYSATTTINGVTFTNNGDGTITVNGTATARTVLIFNAQNLKISKGNKVCLNEALNIEAYNKFWFEIQMFYTDEDSRYISDVYNNVLVADKDVNKIVGYIVVGAGETVNGTLTPQFYNLTEMYGAGNEPATVAEFKAKFPNELYDYSPRCWVKSYKTGLIAETKNLFNINALTPYTPETLPPETAGVYNGHIITKCNSGTSVSKSHKLLKELCPDLVAGERYVLHFDTNGTGNQANTIYLFATKTVWTNGYPHIVTEAELNGTVYFYGNYPSLDVATISNFQIEKGTTATGYVPYGYL